MKRNIDDELDIFMEVVPVTSLFMPENKGNAEIQKIFSNIFVSAKSCQRDVWYKIRPFLSETSVSFMHRDVFDRDKNIFENRLIVNAYSKCPHYVALSISSDGYFQASCEKCHSKIGMYLDEGHINICEHELKLLLGIDFLMSDNGNYIADYKMRRMKRLLAKQKVAYKNITDDDPPKMAMLSCGMAFAGFEWMELKCDEKHGEQIHV